MNTVLFNLIWTHCLFVFLSFILSITCKVFLNCANLYVQSSLFYLYRSKSQISKRALLLCVTLFYLDPWFKQEEAPPNRNILIKEKGRNVLVTWHLFIFDCRTGWLSMNALLHHDSQRSPMRVSALQSLDSPLLIMSL